MWARTHAMAPRKCNQMSMIYFVFHMCFVHLSSNIDRVVREKNHFFFLLSHMVILFATDD